MPPSIKHRLQRPLPISGWDLLLVLILGLGTARFLVPTLAMLLGVSSAQTGGAPAIMLLLSVQTVIVLLAVYLIIICWRDVTWGEIGFSPVTSTWMIRAIGLAFLSFPVVGAISWIQQQVLGQPFHNPQFQTLVPETFTWTGYLLTLVVAGGLAPLMEEIVFRALLFQWLEDRIGFLGGAFSSAFVFSLLHGIPSLIPGIMALGVLLAWVYRASESIWAPIILHATYNIVVTSALYAALSQGFHPGSL